MTGDLASLLPCKGLSPEPTIFVESPASMEVETCGMFLAVPSENVAFLQPVHGKEQFPLLAGISAVLSAGVSDQKPLPSGLHSDCSTSSMVHKLVSEELRRDIRTQGVVETKDYDWQCQSPSQFHG